MTTAATDRAFRALIYELYMIYARDHPSEKPAVIRRWAEREAQYQQDEREAIQNEPPAV